MKFLPPLTFNSFFIKEFIEADNSSAAIGILEEYGKKIGFLAIKPDKLIPGEFTQGGINFGHQLFANDKGNPILRLSIEIYNYQQYHFFLNPNNDIVKKVLHLIKDTGDMFHFIFNETGLLAFKDKMEGESKYLLASNLKIIDKAKTTNDEFIKMRNSAAEQLEGVHLNWLCGDNKKFIDLSDKKYRYELQSG
jgi:hypothetical protein